MSPIRILPRPTRLGCLVSVAIAAALVVAGCSTPAPPGSSADPPTSEVNPLGDIPDDQAFVAYTPTSGTYTATVPEGWAQSSSGAATTFTDKLNAARFEEADAAHAPTVETVKSTLLPQLQTDHPGFALTDVTEVTRAGDSAVLIRYEQDAAANAVTETAGREAVEEYLFEKDGKLVTVTLTSPVGADNVDPWRQITDSFAWR
jgi:hypothetical protein